MMKSIESRLVQAGYAIRPVWSIPPLKDPTCCWNCGTVLRQSSGGKLWCGGCGFLHTCCE